MIEFTVTLVCDCGHRHQRSRTWPWLSARPIVIEARELGWTVDTTEGRRRVACAECSGRLFQKPTSCDDGRILKVAADQDGRTWDEYPEVR